MHREANSHQELAGVKCLLLSRQSLGKSAVASTERHGQRTETGTAGSSNRHTVFETRQHPNG